MGESILRQPPISADELVTRTAKCEDVPGMRMVVLDFLAESKNIIVDGSCFGYFLEAPHVFQELITRDNFSFVGKEILEQLKFTGIGCNSLTVLEEFMADKVDSNGAENDLGSRLVLRETARQAGLDKNLEHFNFTFGDARDGPVPRLGFPRNSSLGFRADHSTP